MSLETIWHSVRKIDLMGHGRWDNQISLQNIIEYQNSAVNMSIFLEGDYETLSCNTLSFLQLSPFQS